MLREIGNIDDTFVNLKKETNTQRHLYSSDQVYERIIKEIQHG